jgi:hypothetical protein
MNSRKQLTASERRKQEALCRNILAYLKRNPNAEDTLEGIAQWWLLEQQIRTETERVSAALRRLVEENRLIARSGPDGRISYRLNRP